MGQVSKTDETDRGDFIVDIARTWVGTPYRHQASCKGAGTDCLGLLRGVWREVPGPEPAAVPPYSPDWAEVASGEPLLDAARRYLEGIPTESRLPGDVVLMRMRETGAAKHLGIIARSSDGQETMIHAYSGYGVCELSLSAPWARRIVAAFRFPTGRS